MINVAAIRKDATTTTSQYETWQDLEFSVSKWDDDFYTRGGVNRIVKIAIYWNDWNDGDSELRWFNSLQELRLVRRKL